MQSSWAIGYGLAAAVNYLVQDVFGLGWRSVFFAGILPCPVCVVGRSSVAEPAMWRDAQKSTGARISFFTR
jgi:hypothetical protein